MAFTPQIIDHFEHPRHAGEMVSPDVRIRVENPVCGDILEIAAALHDGVLRDVRFKAKGCVASMAAASVLAEIAFNAPLSALTEITRERISSALGDLPAESLHAAVLAQDAARELAAACARNSR